MFSDGGIGSFEEDPSNGPFGFGPALKLDGDKVLFNMNFVIITYIIFIKITKRSRMYSPLRPFATPPPSA